MARSKKEIAKELMYQKILPTSSQSEEEKKAPVTMVDPVLFATKQAEEEKQPEIAFVPEPAPKPVPAPAPEPVVEEQPAQLVNLMEGFVEARIDEVMHKFNCCTCDKCRQDILAMTLNKLPPFYVLEDDLNIRDQKEKERSADVAAALVKAVLAVKANPNH